MRGAPESRQSGARDHPERLISSSADRTLLARRGDDGCTQLFKIYERGSMADAQAEAEIGGLVTVEGVVRYAGARRDPRTGRPCVVMDYHPGLNLEQYRADRGPLPPEVAMRIAAAMARALSGLHGATPAGAPHGVVHRDVKPTNVFLAGEPPDPATAEVLLLDFEHAAPIGDLGDAVAGFTGGTHGFAPPEAYRGARPDAAFDVFGLGATLHYMLTGCPPFTGGDAEEIGRAVREDRRPRWHLWGQREHLADLVNACLATDPAARPAMSEVATTLGKDCNGAPDAELDAVLAAVQRSDLTRAAALLDASTRRDEAPRRHAELVRLLRQRRRVLERAAEPEAPPGRDPHQLAHTLATSTPRLQAWLTRFAGSPSALARCRQAHHDLVELLHRAPLAVTAHKRAGEFDRAEELLQTTMAAARATDALPRAAPAADRAADDGMPGPMHREPHRYLQLALQDLREAAAKHRALVELLEAAEADLDLNGAHRVLDTAASQYGGASEIVAGLKDRAHRLGFFLERISHPAPSLRELAEQLAVGEIDVDLEPIGELQRLCADRAVDHRLEGLLQRTSSVRVLHRMLHDLLAEFPHTEAVIRKAVSALDEALETLTDQCWELIEDARQKLQVQPIPVRPLQLIVHRLDAFRRLEVLVDRPGRPRAELLDEHERLRLEVDQARTARDRLARGAEAAMERGHWTTALYDMERAVDRFSGETDDIGRERDRMVEQLEVARRKKEEIDRATTDNIRLAAHYAELQDDAESDAGARLGVLEERQRLLSLLVASLPAERANPYSADLREVELLIAQERTEHVEHSMRRRQLRWRLIPTAVIVALPVAIGLTYLIGLGAEDPLADLTAELDSTLSTPFELTESGGRPVFDKAGAYAALSDFVQRLERAPIDPGQLPAERELVSGATRLVRSVGGLLNQGPDFALETWAAEFAVSIDDYRARLAEVTAQIDGQSAARPLLGHLQRFGERALVAGLFIALVDPRSAPQKQALAPLAARAPAAVRATAEELLK